MSAEPIDQETARLVLDLPMRQPNDADAETVREYLVELLGAVWREVEGFSGKGPFGNSGWVYDLYLPLVNAGLLTATLDEDGYLADMSGEQQRYADVLIEAAIRELGGPQADSPLWAVHVADPIDVIVRTTNPELLDRTVQQLGPFAVVEGSFNGDTCRVRAFQNAGYLKFAIQNQGYGEVVGEGPIS